MLFSVVAYQPLVVYSNPIHVLLPRAREICVYSQNHILYKSCFNHFFFDTYIPNVGLLHKISYDFHIKRWSHSIFLFGNPISNVGL